MANRKSNEVKSEKTQFSIAKWNSTVEKYKNFRTVESETLIA